MLLNLTTQEKLALDKTLNWVLAPRAANLYPVDHNSIESVLRKLQEDTNEAVPA